MNSSAIRSPMTATRRPFKASSKASSRDVPLVGVGIHTKKGSDPFIQNQAGRLYQVRHDRHRYDMRRTVRRFCLAVPRFNEDAFGARRQPHLDVTPTVANG